MLRAPNMVGGSQGEGTRDTLEKRPKGCEGLVMLGFGAYDRMAGL